ncbi:mannitol dehydrogenase family protein [Herbidospora sp. NBRC 101105]|uniref:mannitol dehydrogenase family protein n=1 Tax=Herbidospora sp. NBRC 101105 TaxID=3032195 RepID=UPI0024A3872D|nr:mannitol dehydrogenase family protein [Herbidospora sp. NBRC 101105]GLX97401.1 mannitol dehydrogenase [Herbidospora sp. NBRC 101105]
MTGPRALLGRTALAGLPAECRPLIEPGAAGPGVVHLGLGAFFRAHQAIYTEEAMASAGGDWGIVAVAPRSRAVHDALRAQDLMFAVASTAARRTDVRVVAALTGVVHAAGDPDGVVALLADPRIRVVTLTLTEKAYVPAGETAVITGLLTRGLLARARADAGPLAVVSCDNLPGNGARLRELIGRTVRADTRAQEWIAGNVTFPGTTVDRIVPAVTPGTLDLVRERLGVTDLAAVRAEPYRQWIIEDAFPHGRPAWDRAGAVLTADTGPYDELKLRTLNGLHSSLAYLGALAGRATIAETLALPQARVFAELLLAEEILPTLTPPEGIDPAAYGRSVLDRFANPAIHHRTLQIATDGSHKLPARIVRTVLDRRAQGAPTPWAALVVAAWMRFVQGTADDGRPLPLDDPLADRIRSALATAGPGPAGVVAALLDLRAVFPSEFAHDTTLRKLIVGWLTTLTRRGAAATLAGM